MDQGQFADFLRTRRVALTPEAVGLAGSHEIDWDDPNFEKSYSVGEAYSQSKILLPALYAATHPDADGAKLYVPGGFHNLTGAPAEQEIYKPARDMADGARL